MRRWPIPLLIALAAVTPPIQGEPPAEAVQALVNAEKKFAQTAQEKGTRAAFLEFLAPDAIVFAPAPVNGQ